MSGSGRVLIGILAIVAGVIALNARGVMERYWASQRPAESSRRHASLARRNSLYPGLALIAFGIAAMTTGLFEILS